MKKLIYIAVFIASGLVFMSSCTADAVAKENVSVSANEAATPGDALIPIKPPKK